MVLFQTVLQKQKCLPGVAGELTKATPLETDGIYSKRFFHRRQLHLDNSTVIKIYYERKMVTVTISSRSGFFENNVKALTAKR